MQRIDHELVSLIYQSATDPTLWPKVPKLLARSLGTHQAIIIRAENSQIRSDDIETFGIDESIRQEYIDILDDDPWLIGMLDLPAATPCFSDQFLTLQELRRTPFYHALCKPADVAYMGGAIIRNDSDMKYMFACQRHETLGMFCEKELAQIRMLASHFDKARALGQKIGALQQSVRDLRSLLDKSTFGVFLIDENATVTWCNTPAESMIRDEDGLTLHLSRLGATECETKQVINAALKDAISTSCGRGHGAGAYVAVQRPSNKRAYQLTISPISKRATWAAGVFAIVFVLDPDRPSTLPFEAFRSLFGLTAAEARVARKLLQSRTVREIADEFDVSTNTVRTQLKSILRKCNVRSQSELMLLLTRAALH